MGGNNRQSNKKVSSSSAISFSAFNNLFKRKPRRVEDYSYDEISCPRRVFPSDEDGRGPWRVADPCIDTKTSAFLAHFHSTRFSEPDRQIYQPAAKA